MIRSLRLQLFHARLQVAETSAAGRARVEGEKIGLDIVKTAMEWLQLPHWLMIAGTLLVIAGLIGLVISRRQQAKVQDDPANEPSPEPRPQLPPLPDLLDSRPRKSRR
jgi:hypothetical protein